MVLSSHSDAESSLLEATTVDGSVDHNGRPALRSSSGGWISASFIIGVEIAERFAYFGISSNLITYLTGPLGKSNAAAAENVNAWAGTASLLPLLGAFIADSFLGRFRTIVVASVIYILGLGLLTLSAVLPSHGSSHCQTVHNMISCSSYQLKVLLFFFSLYLVAVGQSGHKPCVQAFGADQFDGKDPEEIKAKSSFFNWWYFGICAGSTVTLVVSTYIQDNLNWALGFGIPCTAMVVALIVFLLGTKAYRYSIKGDQKSPFLRISNVYVTAFWNWRTSPSAINTEQLTHHGSEQFKFLNKASLAPNDSKKGRKVCSLSDIEEAKAVLRLVPIWATSLVYAIVFAQCSTFFTKQGVTLNRTITPGFDISAASLQSIGSLTIMIILPMYDCIFVPIARGMTRKHSGISMLQRIGTGMFFVALSMVVAALVEIKRLRTAQEFRLVDRPNVTIPMSVWWLVPQYVVLGVAEVFMMVGLQEFFYDQVPHELRSVGMSLYLSIFGVGNLLSSFLVSIIDKATGGDGRDSWFSNNLNHAHLDYFYWLLAGLCAVDLAAYLYFSKSYI